VYRKKLFKKKKKKERITQEKEKYRKYRYIKGSSNKKKGE
jgi:hypothetical protein